MKTINIAVLVPKFEVWTIHRNIYSFINNQKGIILVVCTKLHNNRPTCVILITLRAIITKMKNNMDEESVWRRSGNQIESQ